MFKKILDCLFAIELLVYFVEKILFLNSNSARHNFVESHSFEHHQKECLCPENQMDNHREHAWLFSIITTTTLPLGWPIRQGQGQQFDLAWETLASHVRSFRNYVGPFHVVFLFYFMTIIKVFWWPSADRNSHKNFFLI